MLLNVGLKHLFQRPRPILDEPLVELVTYSFPSGHAVASTVFYGAACALVCTHVRSPALRVLAVGAAIAMVLLVTFSRVYLGAHYLSDVVAGVAVGLASLLLFLRWRAR
jgi:undecaprenyl-diphosphatase